MAQAIEQLREAGLLRGVRLTREREEILRALTTADVRWLIRAAGAVRAARLGPVIRFRRGRHGVCIIL